MTDTDKAYVIPGFENQRQTMIFCLKKHKKKKKKITHLIEDLKVTSIWVNYSNGLASCQNALLFVLILSHNEEKALVAVICRILYGDIFIYFFVGGGYLIFLDFFFGELYERIVT